MLPDGVVPVEAIEHAQRGSISEALASVDAYYRRAGDSLLFQLVKHVGVHLIASLNDTARCVVGHQWPDQHSSTAAANQLVRIVFRGAIGKVGDAVERDSAMTVMQLHAAAREIVTAISSGVDDRWAGRAAIVVGGVVDGLVQFGLSELQEIGNKLQDLPRSDEESKIEYRVRLMFAAELVRGSADQRQTGDQ